MLRMTLKPGGQTQIHRATGLCSASIIAIAALWGALNAARFYAVCRQMKGDGEIANEPLLAEPAVN